MRGGRVGVILAAVLGLSLLAVPANASGPTVTVGNAYQNANRTGSAQHINIVPYQGVCDTTGYLTHNPTDPGKKYNTGISSVSLGSAASGWSIDSCDKMALYTGTQGTSNFKVCAYIAHYTNNVGAGCNDVITYIKVYH